MTEVPRTRITRLFAGLAVLVVIVEAVSYFAGPLVDDQLQRMPGIDKVLHVVAFFTLLTLCTWLVKRHAPALRAPVLVTAIALGLLAVGDETAQAWQLRRQQEKADVAASFCGLLLGMAWVERRTRPILATVGGVLVALTAAGIVVRSVTIQRHLNLAAEYERAWDFANARREFRWALDAGVETAGLFNELSWVEIESGEGDPVQAVRWAEQALALRADDPDIWDTYGWALHHAGRSPEALDWLERARRADPTIFCVNYHLGQVLVTLGRQAEGVDRLREQLAFQGTREAALARKALENLGLSP